MANCYHDDPQTLGKMYSCRVLICPVCHFVRQNSALTHQITHRTRMGDLTDVWAKSNTTNITIVVLARGTQNGIPAQPTGSAVTHNESRLPSPAKTSDGNVVSLLLSSDLVAHDSKLAMCWPLLHGQWGNLQRIQKQLRSINFTNIIYHQAVLVVDRCQRDTAKSVKSKSKGRAHNARVQAIYSIIEV